MSTIQSINPFTEELNKEFFLLSEEEALKKINLAYDSFNKWKNVSKKEKKELFLNLASIIEEDILEIAKLQTIEMGMLYKSSITGLKSTISLIRWFAENFEEILGEKEFDSEGITGKVMYDPLGVIFGIAPWNFPYNQVLRAAVPNILAGNTQIYKHASNVPMCANKIEELFLKAGFPEGIYINFPISSSFSEKVLENPKVAGVNLTGGEKAGVSIGSFAGKNIKPSILELGGNDAFVVCETKNLDFIVESAVSGRLRNGGQACNSSKRFIVLEKYYDEFCEKLTKKMESLIIGDPMNEYTQVQPLSSEKLLNEVLEQVERSIKTGAKLLTGGKRIKNKGFFCSPTVLADVKEGVASFDEEIFGPVASIIKSKSIEESIKIANNSSFGLSACVFGDSESETRYVASKIEAGMIFINNIAGSKANLPFGGVKKSGYGKENGPDGLLAFTNKKIIVY